MQKFALRPMNVKKRKLDSGNICHDEGSTLQLFPLVRYQYPKFNTYFACGNTRAEDLLQGCAGVEKPLVLSLGCGDFRHCFYTMWKNFDSNVPKQPDGADFLFNDKSSAVLARNIMFVLMCLKLPKNVEERKAWLSAMWAVWYCLELYPLHQKILDDCLKLLLKYSESIDVWKSADNPLHNLVRFTSPVVLCEIAQVWKMWVEMHVPVEQILASHHELSHCSRYQADHILTANVGESEKRVFKITSAKVKARIPELISHWTSGSSYAECVFNTDLPNTSTTANSTLYESPEEYTFCRDSDPFMSYHHAVEFSPEAMKMGGTDNDVYMFVQSEGFKLHPLLANSVQQFSMWIQSSNKVLNERGGDISYTFNNQDALKFCQELQYGDLSGKQFDCISSSNLIDYLGLPNVVLCALPLLKPEGLLFTGTMLYRRTNIKCIEDFLSMCFGFDCELLPVILGIRCINHEGSSLLSSYSSPVMIQPIDARLQLQQTKLLWQKVSGKPMLISQLPLLEPGNVTEGLVNSFLVSTLSLMTWFTDEDKIRFVRSNCIETAMLVFQTFMSSVSTCGDYHFCEPLTTALIQELKPFLCGLQTQALLHDLHMHFTVDELSCPMCKQSLMEEYIGLFCAEVPLTSIPKCSSFMALIHPYSSLQVTGGQYLSLHDKDIHVIDCFDGTVCGNNLILNFFAPKHFTTKNFNVTMAYTVQLREERVKISLLPTTNISSMQMKFVHYRYFSKRCPAPFNVCCPGFGEVVSNIYTRNSSVSTNGGVIYTQNSVITNVALSGSVLKGLSLSNLSTKEIAPNEIQLAYGALELDLKYLYSVDYNGINLKLSTEQVEIICPRKIHQFTEEKPLFITHPDHHLSLPPLDDKKETLSRLSGMCCQFADPYFMLKVEKKFEVNEILANFFQCDRDTCIFLLTSCSRGKVYVFVNNCMFDYEHYAPVVDLAFCFFEDNSNPKSIECVKMENHKSIPITDMEYDELKEALLYFAKRTNGDCVSAGVDSVYNDLVQLEVDKYFTRAVVYFKYYNQVFLNQVFHLLQCGFCCNSGILKTSCKVCGRGKASKEWQVYSPKQESPDKQQCLTQ